MDAVRWHHVRHTTLVRHHPDVRALQGPSAWSAVAIVSLVALQFSLAALLRDAPLGWIALAAFAVGAFVAHALGVLIHEAAHNLIVRGSDGNRIWALIANAPLVIPGAMDFRFQHLLHHKHLGEVSEGRDTQGPGAREVRLVGSRSAWRKAAWLTFGPVVFQGTHAADSRTHGRWLMTNVVTQVMIVGTFTLLAGWHALAFLALSGLMAFGVHPVGIRRYGEHLAVRPDQPTVSYYGPLNRLAFNVGYHVEHHDMPAVSWLRLPALRRAAPELYDPLHSERSWVSLSMRLLVDPQHGPHRYTGVPAAWREGSRASTTRPWSDASEPHATTDPGIRSR